MIRIKTQKAIVRIAMVAALYVVITIGIAPISYGPVQFRVSEILTLLAYVDPLYIPGLVIGCVIANFWSPLGVLDVIVGTFATFLSVYLISKTKNLLIATLWPTLNGIFVGIELYVILGMPLWLSISSVALSEFIVVTCIGYPVFKFLLSRKDFVKILKG